VTVQASLESEMTATPLVDQQLVAELVARAGAEGVSLTGEGGLLQQLTKLVLEASLEGEMDSHLGYTKHDPAGRNSGNSRNGKRKTVLTQVGPVEVEVPRDRDASFEPQIVRKRQRRLDVIGPFPPYRERIIVEFRDRTALAPEEKNGAGDLPFPRSALSCW
jgi:putative transposase